MSWAYSNVHNILLESKGTQESTSVAAMPPTRHAHNTFFLNQFSVTTLRNCHWLHIVSCFDLVWSCVRITLHNGTPPQVHCHPLQSCNISADQAQVCCPYQHGLYLYSLELCRQKGLGVTEFQTIGDRLMRILGEEALARLVQNTVLWLVNFY